MLSDKQHIIFKQIFLINAGTRKPGKPPFLLCLHQPFQFRVLERLVPFEPDLPDKNLVAIVNFKRQFDFVWRDVLPDRLNFSLRVALVCIKLLYFCNTFKQIFLGKDGVRLDIKSLFEFVTAESFIALKKYLADDRFFSDIVGNDNALF